MVATPLAFQMIQVSTVVAAHWTSPEAIARWRSFCGIFFERHVEAVLLEDAGLLGERQRREAGPAGVGRSRPWFPGRRRARRARAAATPRVSCEDGAHGVLREVGWQRISANLGAAHARLSTWRAAQRCTIGSARPPPRSGTAPAIPSAHASRPRPRRLPPHAVEERRRAHDRDRVASAGCAAFAHFAWRVERRRRRADGPFSAFPGIDRTLVLLAGARRAADRRRRARSSCARRTSRCASRATSPCDCALVDGPARDFNLMVRRGASRAATSPSCADGGRRSRPARFRLCYAAAGACECLLPGHAPLRLHAGARCWSTRPMAPHRGACT